MTIVQQHTIVLESVGDVLVSTIQFPDARGRGITYYEVAVIWPTEWEGCQYLPCEDDDGFMVEGCFYSTSPDAREDAADRHAYWANEENLARMAAATIRNKWTREQWFGKGRVGTWEERMASA